MSLKVAEGKTVTGFRIQDPPCHLLLWDPTLGTSGAWVSLCSTDLNLKVTSCGDLCLGPANGTPLFSQEEWRAKDTVVPSPQGKTWLEGHGVPKMESLREPQRE